MLVANVVVDFAAEIDRLLRKHFNKQLFYPKEDDQCRLLKLRVWSERYQVSVVYILSVLIPYFEKLAHKHSRVPREKVSKGIGTTISVLTGPVAEAYLLEQIIKDFPDGEHKVSWKEEKKQECFDAIDQADGDVRTKKPKGILNYSSIYKFKNAYIHRIDHMRKDEERIINKLRKQPWRNNPFR